MMKKIVLLLVLFLLPIVLTSVDAQEFYALNYIRSIGETGENPGQFQQPAGLSVDLAGNIYVADTGNNRIQKFDAEGNFVVYLGGIGSGREQFDNPSDISAPDGLNVYVTDYNNHRIHLLDRKLNAVSIFNGSLPKEVEFQFSFPKSIAISKQGDIFIVENEENSILKFNSFYTPVNRFGAIETGEGKLEDPVRIELIDNDFICVADRLAARVVLFDYFGNFVKFIGENILINPVGLCFWAEKKILLISDFNRQEIVAFTLSGRQIGVHVLQKSADKKWQAPVDLAVLQNRLFVLDQDKNQILVYEILKTSRKE